MWCLCDTLHQVYNRILIDPQVLEQPGMLDAFLHMDSRLSRHVIAPISMDLQTFSVASLRAKQHTIWQFFDSDSLPQMITSSDFTKRSLAKRGSQVSSI